MDLQMSADEVVASIARLHGDGTPLSKKSVKKSHPELMKSALYYYPSWEHALEKSGIGTVH